MWALLSPQRTGTGTGTTGIGTNAISRGTAPLMPSSSTTPWSKAADEANVRTVPAAALKIGPELRALRTLDATLIKAVAQRHVRLLRVTWLLRQSDTRLINSRQELEAEEAEEAAESPYLQPDEAVELIYACTRSVALLSAGSLTPGHPDPCGERFKYIHGPAPLALILDATLTLTLTTSLAPPSRSTSPPSVKVDPARAP